VINWPKGWRKHATHQEKDTRN